MEQPELTKALETLGELLSDRGLSFEVTAIGAGSLLLTGQADRATRDLDVVAVRRGGDAVDAQPLPAELHEAIRDVARALDLDDDWLNSEPADVARLGLPDGFYERSIAIDYRGLLVHHAGRFDQVCFKLHAAVDRGPRSKHLSDLRNLEPTRDELVKAALWTRTHDPSEGFRQGLHAALESLGISDHGCP